MTPERWKRVESVLGAAMDATPEVRQAILEEAGASDPGLRRAVESLLAFDADGEHAVAGVIKGSFQDLEGAMRGLPEGTRLGVYKVVREIGRGGMGTVYLAERDDDQFEKRVAVKVVTRGMDTVALLSRFRHERQILARLEHPCIARLLDGGSTAEGLPFLVMEYVEGKTITNWCAEQKLSQRERIELFRHVCAAVQSAHRNLVVHRDLKPGNILVGQDGMPKLLDFGIAKLIDSEVATDMTMAMPGISLLTPDYGSPEQLRGAAITTSADIYALGAILYELLSGVRPHRFEDTSRAEMERVICDEMPLKPSEAQKKSQQTAAPPMAAGDLDNIILMAMQKEPGRRYGSVAELSDDLQRYLAGLPVRARQDTFLYRSGKFLRRNWLAAAASSLIIASLATGITLALAASRRAERRFNELQLLSHAVMFDIYDAITPLPGAVKAREVVVKTAIQYLDGLAKDAGDDPESITELAEAYIRVGDVQGGTQQSLGKTAEAVASYKKALALVQGLPARALARSKNALAVRMEAYTRLGEMASRRGNDEAGGMKYLLAGIAMAESAPAGLLDRYGEVKLGALYSTAAMEDSDRLRSIQNARKSLALAEKLAAHESGPDAQIDLASAYSVLGASLLRNNDLKPAAEYLEKSIQVREALVAKYPENPAYQHDLMISYNKTGVIYGPGQPSLHDPEKAVANYRKAIQIADHLAATNPADLRAQYDRAMARSLTAFSFPPAGHGAEALELLREAQTIFEGLAEKDPNDRSIPMQLWYVQLRMIPRWVETGNFSDAVRNGRDAVRKGLVIEARSPKSISVRAGLLHLYENLIRIPSPALPRGEALAYAEKAVSEAQSLRQLDPANAVTQSYLPEAYGLAGDLAAGASEWSRALDLYSKSASGWQQIQLKNGSPDNRDPELARVRAAAAVAAAKLSR